MIKLQKKHKIHDSTKHLEIKFSAEFLSKSGSNR